MRVLDPLFSHWFIATTPVVGRFDLLPEPGAQAVLTRIFVVRQDRMTPIALRARAHPDPDTDHVWHPLSDVEGDDFDVYPRELGPFLRGYLEGWIRDGTITLVE